MAPVLYLNTYSVPSRATLMTVRALNIDVEIKEVDLMKEQQLSSDFVKLNPQHTVPTLIEENGFVLWESHAIMPYLVDKYGKDDSLYPKDLQKRATINQRLHFDGAIFNAAKAIFFPLIYQGVKIIAQDRIEAVKEMYDFLEKFLEGTNWVAGDVLTIADFSIISSVTSTDIVVPIDSKIYPKITAWIRRMETLPFYSINNKGLHLMRNIVEEKLK